MSGCRAEGVWGRLLKGCPCSSFQGDGKVLRLERGRWRHIVSALDATEVYGLKLLIVCYVHFTSIFFFKSLFDSVV